MKNKNVKMAIFSSQIHNNFIINYLINLTLNLIILLSLLGLDIYKEKLNISFLYVTLIYTTIDVLLKYPYYKYLWKYIILSLGILNVVFNAIIFLGLINIFENSYYFKKLGEILIFVIIFSLLRRILKNYIKSYLIKKELKKDLGEVIDDEKFNN